ncbi:hypothetical protein DPMN_001956 [Dreissena polymorpha]|uniref:Uncharacterized protein n=1 Tax=Dreissena polymorpha TaxID=45954 RepID=A0A9D4MLA9_DREPO|nr:hypothetical protein DPMN_001956 [Dreissena polymorpha]
MENQELIQHVAVLAGKQALLDGQVALLLVRRRRRRTNRRQPRSCWVRPWRSAQKKLQFDHYDRLIAELRTEDQQSFFNFLKIPLEMFARHTLQESARSRSETCDNVTTLGIWRQVPVLAVSL